MIAGVAAGCDQAIAFARKGRPCVKPTQVLIATVLASSLAFLDGAVVNIALPSIGRELPGGQSSLQWLVTGYLLPLSVLQLLAGALGDHFGRKRVLLIGTSLFTVASAICATSMTMETLLAARIFQGVGAALLLPNSLAVLGASFVGEARGRAVGTWTAAGAIAAALGPPFAGWLVDDASWRFVFLINLPLGAAALWITIKAVPESANGELPLDIPGTLIATVAMSLLTWAVTNWSLSGLDLTYAAFGLAGIAGLGAMIVLEKRRGADAMIPLAMFGSPTFVGLNLYTFLIYAAFGALFVLLPYVLMTAHGYSAVEAGSALLPLPITLGLASRWAGSYSSAHGWKVSLIIGAELSAVGYGLLVIVNDGSYWREVFPGVMLVSIGMTIVVAPLTTAILSSVDDAHTATAAGFNSAISRSGTLMAIAAAGMVMVGDKPTIVAASQVSALAGFLLCTLGAAIVAIASRATNP